MEIGNLIKWQDLENYLLLKIAYATRAIGKTINFMEKENFTIKIQQLLQGNAIQSIYLKLKMVGLRTKDNL